MIRAFVVLALVLQSQAPLVGMATLHNAMPAVLANYPDRACAYCDGYVAVEQCSDVGRDYLLFWQGETYLVRAADCMAPQHRAGVQSRYAAAYGLPWLVDIEAALWGDAPVRPLPAVLIPVEMNLCAQTQMSMTGFCTYWKTASGKAGSKMSLKARATS